MDAIVPDAPLHARLDHAIGQARSSLVALAGSAAPGLDATLARALADLSRVAETSAAAARIARPSRRFLVADDSEDVRFLVARMVRRAAPDAQVTAVGNGEEALDALASAGDGEGLVVISDHDMGAGRTGAEMLAEVARRHPKARRVLLTGHPRHRIPLGEGEPHAILQKEGGLDPLRRLLASL